MNADRVLAAVPHGDIAMTAEDVYAALTGVVDRTPEDAALFKTVRRRLRALARAGKLHNVGDERTARYIHPGRPDPPGGPTSQQGEEA